jgi:hypothetical protein
MGIIFRFYSAFLTQKVYKTEIKFNSLSKIGEVVWLKEE